MEPTFFDSLTQMVFSVGAVILLFGGTVLIHELGHFMTAKWFGLRIDAFSIGMGPALWKKTINGVVYKISLLPIGGYVALPQMDITGSAFENEDAKAGVLEPVAPWKRIVISIAGPFMNVLGAILLCSIVWWQGKPSDPGPGPAIVGMVSEKSAAYEEGLREGDRVRMVNEDRVHFWADLQIAAMLNKTLDLQVIRNGEVVELYDIPTDVNQIGYRYLKGVGPDETGLLYIKVAGVEVGSPAEAAGVLPDDRLVSVDGVPITGGSQFVAAVQSSEGQPMELVVQRNGNGELATLELTPALDEELGRLRIGISMQGEFELQHPTPLSQIHYFTGSILRTLKAFTRPQEAGNAAQGIGGPVMILSGMHSQVRLHPMQALWFTALININLAIINLLPLIILDGGHIMVALFEMITGRKPHKGLIVGMANTMVFILIALMVVLSVRDVSLLKKLNAPLEPEEPETVETPTEEPTPGKTAEP